MIAIDFLVLKIQQLKVFVMATNDKDKNKEEKDRNPGEGTFTRDTRERNQDFSNEQDPNADEGKETDEHVDKSSGNLSDQYHSVTETGEFQEKQNEEMEKKAHRGKEYYDQGAHQPSASDMKKVDKENKEKE